MKRDPRKDPAPGDVIEHAHGGMHKVRSVEDGVVYYLDDGLTDCVPIERWRKWYVGRRDCKVITAAK